MYLDYFELSAQEFHAVLDKWTNRELFTISAGSRVPKFVVA
jgi:hypothetical protein